MARFQTFHVGFLNTEFREKNVIKSIPSLIQSLFLQIVTVFKGHILKGAGNIEYGDIKNGEIEKTGTSKMNQREYLEKNNCNSKIKIENGEIENLVRNPFLNNTSIPVC